MGIDEVNSLVTLLIQTDRFGTSVAQALRVFSDSFRTARYQKAEEIARRSERSSYSRWSSVSFQPFSLWRWGRLAFRSIERFLRCNAD